MKIHFGACLFMACVALVSAEPDHVAEPKHWSDWDTVKVAAAQTEIHTGDELDWILKYIARAGKDGAEMIVLGEYILGPFEGPESPNVKAVAEAARREGIYVVVGGWEELEPGAFAARKQDAYRNTTLIFDRDGSILGRFSKVHPAVGEPPYFWPPQGHESEWLMAAGEAFPTFQLDFARVGIMTCYDGYFSESAASLSLQGAEIIIWNNGRAGPVEPWLVKADMYRNYCAMITTNLAPGSGTMIGIWPDLILAHVQETGNHYITGELDLRALRTMRANSRVFHQRRPAMYRTLTEPHAPWEVYRGHGFEIPPVLEELDRAETASPDSAEGASAE